MITSDLAIAMKIENIPGSLADRIKTTEDGKVLFHRHVMVACPGRREGPVCSRKENELEQTRIIENGIIELVIHQAIS